MDNLPEDLADEILSRLQVKTLLSLKSVCKSWRSKISNPHFSKLQLIRNMTNPNHNDYFIAHQKQQKRQKLSLININTLDRAITLNLPLPASRLSVVGSCNGLLCLAYKRKKQRQRMQKRLYLWNPATIQVKNINHYTIKESFGNPKDIYHLSLGFGFDLISCDFKVVRIVTNWTRLVSRVEVYSLNKNSWKEIDAENLKYRVIHMHAAIVKGSPSWIIIKENNLVTKRFALVSFNVKSEKFITSSLPDGMMCRSIYEYKESVAIVSWTKCDDISIWTLDNDNCWIKKFTLTDPFLKIANIKYINGCLKTGEFVGQKYSNEKVIYDFESGVVKKIPTLKLYT